MKIKRTTGETGMDRAVRMWANDSGDGYDNGAEGAMAGLAYGGCASGMVGSLVYYTDTVKFYRKHREEIGRLLSDLCEDCRQAPWELLRDFDRADVLCLDQFNQNLLAWFGFEETARRMANEQGWEV